MFARLPLSVLFYEPKFPKLDRGFRVQLSRRSFSALLRAEIPKIVPSSGYHHDVPVFQCSSTSRNSQNRTSRHTRFAIITFSALLRAEIPKIDCRQNCAFKPSAFSALLRAEIPKIDVRNTVMMYGAYFQCSSTSRNSQNNVQAGWVVEEINLSVLFYEPKFPK